jgi:sec-independent protein translocase protein TatA
MQIFGIGLPEMAVIAAIGLLVFGPKRLPELGKTLGSTLRGFQKASEEFQQEFQQAIHSEEQAAASLPASAPTDPGDAAAAPPVPAKESTPVDPSPDSVRSGA